MGLAVGPDDSAAIDLETAAARRRALEMPDAPVWISIPPAMLKSGSDLPPGTRMFAHTMEDADDVSIAMAPAGSRFEARLNVHAAPASRPRRWRRNSRRITGMLRDMIAREHQTPNPSGSQRRADFGQFQSSGYARNRHLAARKGLCGGSARRRVNRGARFQRAPPRMRVKQRRDPRGATSKALRLVAG